MKFLFFSAGDFPELTYLKILSPVPSKSICMMSCYILSACTFSLLTSSFTIWVGGGKKLWLWCVEYSWNCIQKNLLCPLGSTCFFWFIELLWQCNEFQSKKCHSHQHGHLRLLQWMSSVVGSPIIAWASQAENDKNSETVASRDV